jgi:hypothetical protein
MPVSFTTSDMPTTPVFLIPAPMVQINKEYDRTGDGAIIGVRYPITLEGTLVANMGVPDYTGSFVDGGGTPFTVNQDNSDQVFKEKWMYRAIQNKQMAIRKLFSHHNEGGELHIQALDDEGFKCNPRIISTDFSQDPAQPNIMRYVIQLEVDELGGPPAAGGIADGTATAAGKTSVGLQIDPEGVNADTLSGVLNPYFKYKVSDANESWGLDEQDSKSINYKEVTDTKDPDHRRYRHVTKKDPATLSGFKELTVTIYNGKVITSQGSGEAAEAAAKEVKLYKPIGGYRVQKVSKTYILTHSMSATGKRRFDTAGTNDTISAQPTTLSGANPPNLLDDMSMHDVEAAEWNPSASPAPTGATELEGDGADAVVGSVTANHEKDFVPDGEAWQQARGYILNHISGSDRVHRGPGYQKALTKLDGSATVAGDESAAGSPVNNPFFGNAGFVDMYGVNLPRVGGTAANKNQHQYTACDYKRVQNTDKTAGTFSVTETWVLMDNDRIGIEADPTGYDADKEFDIGLTTETIEFSIEESQDDGFTEVTVAGNITGMSEAQDEYLPTKGAETDAYWNQDKLGISDGTFVGTTASKISRTHAHKIAGTELTDEGLTPVLKGNTKYEEALRRFHWLEPKLHELCQTSTGEQLNSLRKGFSVSKNPTEGTINYSAKFDARNTNTLACVKDENVIVNDTHPSHVFAETSVLGRRMGPVLQDINTQTSWKRNLSVELSVSGVLDGRDWQEAMRNKPSMIINRCFHPDYTDELGCSNAGFTWVDPAVQKCSTGNDLRDLIDAVSPRGKLGTTGWFVSAGPQESWDAINGQYTFSVEWTFEKEEGSVPYGSATDPDAYKKAISRSYLGTRMFQYPRLVEQKLPGAHDTQEQNVHGPPNVEHHAGF